MKETVLVAGGAGFIGANFVRKVLQETSLNVLVVDKMTYAGHRESLEELEEDDRFHFLQADIADCGAMVGALEQFQPCWVVNFAAESHVDRSIDDPHPFIQTNIVGTVVLLEAIKTFLKQVGFPAREQFRFLHISTDEVYGALGASGAFTEETPYAPNSPYAASKAGADHIVRAYHHTYGLPILLTNCSNNYGPFQFPEKLIPLMVCRALSGQTLPIYGQGEQIRDWLYVEDHCEGLLAVLQHGAPGEKYNLGGGAEMTNFRVVESICELLEELVPPQKNPSLTEKGLSRYAELKRFVEDRPGHDFRYAIDFSKIQNHLAWTPRHSFQTGLRRTIEWYVDNQPWCQRVMAENYQGERLGLR